MKSLRRFITLAAVILLSLFAARTTLATQRYCKIPCGHRAHPYDLAPCRHPCYGPYGAYPCHSAGDAYPCVHPLHAFDYVLC